MRAGSDLERFSSAQALAPAAATGHTSEQMRSQSSNAPQSRDEVVDQIERVQTELDRLRAMIGDFDPALPPKAVTPPWIRAIMQARRRRDQVFGEDMFADPGWDILLALYAAALANDRPIITHVCKAAKVSYPTALRWLDRLEAAGLIVRTPDPGDKRRVHLALSRSGMAAMGKYFENPRSGSIAI